MQFSPFGPFEVPVLDGQVNNDLLKHWWKEIDFDGTHTYLPASYGCYIFGIQRGQKITPIYVGRTRTSFKKEILTSHKQAILRDSLKKYKGGKLVVLFLARVNVKGMIRTGDKKSHRPEVAFLEDALIGACLAQNPDLANKNQTGYLRKLKVPGFMNDAGEDRTDSATVFATMLGK